MSATLAFLMTKESQEILLKPVCAFFFSPKNSVVFFSFMCRLREQFYDLRLPQLVNQLLACDFNNLQTKVYWVFV